MHSIEVYIHTLQKIVIFEEILCASWQQSHDFSGSFVIEVGSDCTRENASVLWIVVPERDVEPVLDDAVLVGVIPWRAVISLAVLVSGIRASCKQAMLAKNVCLLIAPV